MLEASRAGNYEIKPVNAYLVRDPSDWADPQSSDQRSEGERLGNRIGEESVIRSAGAGREADRDAYLVIVAQITSQYPRPHSANDLPIRLIDDRGEQYLLSTALTSAGHFPMQSLKEYKERLVFRVFSDTKEFSLLVGEYAYRFAAPHLTESDGAK